MTDFFSKIQKREVALFERIKEIAKSENWHLLILYLEEPRDFNQQTLIEGVEPFRETPEQYIQRFRNMKASLIFAAQMSPGQISPVQKALAEYYGDDYLSLLLSSKRREVDDGGVFDAPEVRKAKAAQCALQALEKLEAEATEARELASIASNKAIEAREAFKKRFPEIYVSEESYIPHSMEASLLDESD